MANKKKDVFKPGPMTEGKRNIIQGLPFRPFKFWSIHRRFEFTEKISHCLCHCTKPIPEFR